MDNQEKLISLKAKREKLRDELNRPDPISQSFHGGMVGFKSGVGRRKWEANIDRVMNISREITRLDDQINRLENPAVRTKATEVAPSLFSVTETAKDMYGTKVTIIKINAKTVTVRYDSGFKETVKPHLLNKIKAQQ